MKRTGVWAARTAIGLAAGLALGQEVASGPRGRALSGSLLVYCAAGVKEPVAEIAKAFEAKTGVKVELTFANSGQLLGQIETTKTGDVYIPGDVGFAAKAAERNLTAGAPREFCWFVPVIYVRKGNPRQIRGVSDLTKPGLKLCLADKSAAIGRIQAEVFAKNGLDAEALRKNTVSSPAMVTDVVLAVKMGTVDAGIVWSAFASFAPDEAEAVAIPLEKNVVGTVAACALAGSKNLPAARAFLDDLVSDKGKAILRSKGFSVDRPSVSDVRSGTPLLVHVGGTMRPAMEELCRLFEQETGAKVEVNYNDSGALMIAIETTGKGDVCVVHDPFAPAMQRKGLVDRIYTVASLTPVIVVRKGNPKRILGVKDLARGDVKVGLTDAVYSTGGHVVALVFRKAGMSAAMDAKDVVRTRAGGEVANAVKIGTIDAAIVWNAVAFARRADLDAIAIDPALLPAPKVDAVTSATYGVVDMSCVRVTLMTLKKAGQPETAGKLAELAVSDRGRALFAKYGFSAPPSGGAEAR